MLEGLTVGGYLPSSFLDWDGHVAAVIFTLGCNFRCPWCHNRDLALSSLEPISASAVVADIARRAKFLDGVVVSGGEPTVWGGLLPLLRELKALGVSVKLDTNGSFPEVLADVLCEGLVSCVAMDVKAPFDAETLKRSAGVDVRPDVLRRSVAIIKEKAPSYEFRTTYVPSLVSKSDMLLLREELSDDAHWIVQCFK
ncbi:MAG: anaerobic ribonucleoside-triphosphate reductase activating protein, partial [Synergistaceae bacterium]